LSGDDKSDADDSDDQQSKKFEFPDTEIQTPLLTGAVYVSNCINTTCVLQCVSQHATHCVILCTASKFYIYSVYIGLID
jgi:hypothetical protein